MAEGDGENSLLPYTGREAPVRTCCPEGEGRDQLNNPSGITIHPDSLNIYISDSKNHRVQIFDPEGNFISTFDTPIVMCDPCGIRVFEDRVYLTQNPGHYITIFHEDGTLLGKFGREGNNLPEEFCHPYDIDVDQSNGDIYICDMDNNRIQIFTRDFQFKTMFQAPFLKRPHNLKLVNKELYILNQTHDGDLLHIREDAMSVTIIKTKTTYPICFTIDQDGNYLILEYFYFKSIKIFSKDGIFLQSIGESVFPAMPRSITVDKQGRVWVVCGTNKKSKNCLYIF